MADRGKTVMLFLMDKDVNARIKATIPGWTGVVYKIPRTSINDCKNRDHLKQSGVYMLFGTNDESGELAAYIGQASARKDGEGLLKRISEHKGNSEEEYWTDAIAITTTDDTFGPTEISYLENRLYRIAVEANRCKIKNGVDPTRGNVSEEKECELEDFIDNVRIIMAALGNKSLVPINEIASISPTQSKIESKPLLHITNSKVDATGRQTSDGFIVYKGSKLASSPTPSCPKHLRAKREMLKKSIGDGCVLSEDVLFNSPSTASGFVKYASSNGRTDWVTEDGRSLQYLEESR